MSEEIINYKRRWFVLLDEAVTILPNLFAQRKPIRDLMAAEAPGRQAVPRGLLPQD